MTPGETRRTGVWRPAPEVVGADGYRTAVLLGLVSALGCVAAVSVQGALVVAGVLMALTRTVDRSAMRLGLRRAAYGPRGSDVPVTLLATPWRAIVSCGVTLIALVIPFLVGASVVFLGLLVVGRNGTPATHSGPVQGIGMAALLLTAWWGPGGGSLRRGTWMSMRRLGRSRVGSWLVLGVLALVVLAALIVVGGR